MAEKALEIFRILCKSSLNSDIEKLADEFRVYSNYSDVKEHFRNIELADIPICLLKNGSIRNILISIYNTSNANRIINIFDKYYNDNKIDTKFNTEFTRLLEIMFVHGYEGHYPDYYLNKINNIYKDNINNIEIARIYARCLEYGFFRTSKMPIYYKELTELFSKFENDEIIVDYYVKSLDILIKQNDELSILDRNVKKIAEIYNIHKSISKYYSDALLKILTNENNAEIKYNILNKLLNISNENKNDSTLVWNYAEGYIDYISYDLENYQKEKFILNDYACNKIYKTIEISFPRNHLVINYDEELDDDEGSSFYEALEIYIFKPNDIVKINDQLQKKNIKKVDLNDLLNEDKLFFSKLSNNNVKELFLYLLFIYNNKSENKCPFNFVSLVENIEYIHSKWSR